MKHLCSLLAGIGVLTACASGAGEDSGETNSLPSIASAEILPELIYESSLVECVGVEWVDLDGDPPFYDLEWLVNGELVGTAATIDGSVFNKGDEITCQLTPLDSGGEGETREVTVRVQNSPPTAESARIDPDPLTVEGTARVVISGEADEDNDAVVWNHVWFVNDVVVSESPLLSGNALIRGDWVLAESTPDDGEGLGETLRSPVVEVANALPSVLSVSIYPSAASAEDLLSAIVSTTDSDGDSVTVSYTWTVNGQEVGSAATLEGLFSANDNVQVNVIPNDGLDDGAEVASDPIAIQP